MHRKCKSWVGFDTVAPVAQNPSLGQSLHTFYQTSTPVGQLPVTLIDMDFLTPEPFSAILQYFQIMRREFCVFSVEPLQPTQGSWLAPLEPPISPKRGPF